MNTKESLFSQFGLCLNNEGYAASLEVRKVYRVIQDDEAVSHGYIRVIDESGEDYAYTANRFHLIQLPIDVKKALSAVQDFDEKHSSAILRFTKKREKKKLTL